MTKERVRILLAGVVWRVPATVFKTDEAQYWEMIERFCLVGSTSLHLRLAVFDAHRLPDRK